jgi:hypothetical protein
MRGMALGGTSLICREPASKAANCGSWSRNWKTTSSIFAAGMLSVPAQNGFLIRVRSAPWFHDLTANGP